jgi:branched-chain amino acid transport system permease protein
MTFAISTALAAVAACLVAPIFMISPSMGSLLGLKAFVIVILGGLGSIPGAIVGGMILGLIEALGAVICRPLIRTSSPSAPWS